MDVSRSPASVCSDDEENQENHAKPHPTYKIMKWLDQNYMYEEGICLPRCLIYEHYSDHCERDNAIPINAASFGKLVHQQFPKITTRRLGTRGQSKYHYFGLGIQRTSCYYDVSYQQKPAPGTKKEGGGRFSHRHYKNREKPGSQLPRFPSVREVKDGTSPDVTVDKVRTFVVMYHAHCQRIYDSVIRANFNDIGDFLEHFWQRIPSHMSCVLEDPGVLKLIAYYDRLLYKCISNVLILTPLHNVPTSLVEEILDLVKSFPAWMESALKKLPSSVKTVKMEVLGHFCQSLRRLTALSELAHAARASIKKMDSPDQMKKDWKEMDIRAVISQSLWVASMCDLSPQQEKMIAKFLTEFSNLVSTGFNLEDVVEWLENVADNIIRPGKEGSEDSMDHSSAGTFCQIWTFISGKIITHLTCQSAASFGVFQLLSHLIDYYLVHTIRSRFEDVEQKKYFSEAQTYFTLEEVEESHTSPDESDSSSHSHSPPVQKSLPHTTPTSHTLLTAPHPQLARDITPHQNHLLGEPNFIDQQETSLPVSPHYGEMYTAQQQPPVQGPPSVHGIHSHQVHHQAPHTSVDGHQNPTLQQQQQQQQQHQQQHIGMGFPAHIPLNPLTPDNPSPGGPQMGVPLPAQFFWQHLTNVQGQQTNPHVIPMASQNAGIPSAVPVLHYVTQQPYIGPQIQSTPPTTLMPPTVTYYS